MYGVQGVSEEELACVCENRFRSVEEYLFPFHEIFVSWSLLALYLKKNAVITCYKKYVNVEMIIYLS